MTAGFAFRKAQEVAGGLRVVSTALRLMMMVDDLDIFVVIVSAIMSGRGFDHLVVIYLRGWRLVYEVLMEVDLWGCKVLLEG